MSIMPGQKIFHERSELNCSSNSLAALATLFIISQMIANRTVFQARWGERELIERFGDGYRQYRARTPASFNLDPRTWVTLRRF